MQTDRVRFTISVDEDVHEAFSTLAAAAGLSLSRCVGDWLRDTAESASLVSMKMNQLRRLPAELAEDLMGHEVSPDILRLVAGHSLRPGADDSGRGGLPPAGGTAKRGVGRSASVVPPSSNTGGKVPRRNPTKSAGKAS